MVVNEINDPQGLGRLQGAFQIEGGWKLLINPNYSILFDHHELFNVIEDPNETTDLQDIFPDIFEDMKTTFHVSFLRIIFKLFYSYQIV
jgi:hypothetical protein